MYREALAKSKWKILEAVELYYVKNLSVSEVAERMNVSSSTVSRMLNDARSGNIVRTIVSDPFLHSLNLSHMLQDRYGLKKCILASTAFYDSRPNDTQLRNDVTLEAARHIQAHMKPDDVVGFGWGHTANQIISKLNPCTHSQTPFVVINGNVSQCLPTIKASPPLERVRMSIKGKLYPLDGPVYHKTRESLSDALARESNRDALDLFPKITIAINGIGSLYGNESAEIHNENFFPCSGDLQELLDNGACANFLYRYFDRDGNEVESDLKYRTFSISSELYMKAKHKILVATGRRKSTAIRAILNGGYVDTLIVDEYLAEELLKA